MGAFISQSGFDLIDINNNCDMFINGHLHNNCMITSKIINIGNICGQNFSEDAFTHNHTYFIFDLEAKSYTSWINYNAFNFYKVDWLDATDVKIKHTLDRLKDNAVLSVTCKEADRDRIVDILDKCEKVLQYRVMTFIEKSDNQPTEELITFNHIDSFRDYVLANIGNSDIIKEELQEILQ